ncbi:MAG: hypothetical protein ACLT98_03615 [Eggerthellaceae bacterium]
MRGYKSGAWGPSSSGARGSRRRSRGQEVSQQEPPELWAQQKVDSADYQAQGEGLWFFSSMILPPGSASANLNHRDHTQV